MSAYDEVLLVHNDWVNDAEPLNRTHKRPHLIWGHDAGIIFPTLQTGDLNVLKFNVGQPWFTSSFLY